MAVNMLCLMVLWCIDLRLSSDSVNGDLFLGSGLVNTFPLVGTRFLIMQQFDYNTGCRDAISKGQSEDSCVLHGRLKNLCC
jgi:hypothetical protein